MPSVSLALWAVNLARPLRGIDDWLAMVDAKLAEAKGAGADLLVLPEYASAQWLGYAPADLPETEEVAFMAAEGVRALARLPGLVERHGVGLLAGTMPAADGVGGFRNRAYLLLPEAGGGPRLIAQDKLCLTPSEKDAAAWLLGTGTTVRVVSWRGLRLAVVICLDIELPALSAALGAAGLDLVLVPSLTPRPSGYHRVFGCAKARAVELQATVAVVGAIGTVRAEAGHSGAAVYVPCEEVLGHHGILADLPPRSAVSGDGPVLVVRDLPIDEVRRLRAGAAEVWPGAWRPERLAIEEV